MYEHISINEVNDIISQSKSVCIVDIRSSDAFNTGHIAKAVHITDENVQEFINTCNKEDVLICYCYRGHSSQGAAAFFDAQGFKKVYTMDGGYEAWRTQYV